MAEREQGANSRAFINKLEAVGWGVFFIWVGVAFLADVGWGTGLLGVGAIFLAAQAARNFFGYPIESFGLITGFVLVLWGAWEILGAKLGEAPIPGGLLPILLIAAGFALVISALLRKTRP